MIVVLATIVVVPVWPFFIWVATVCLADCPRTRQCVVDHRDVVMEDVGVGLVEVHSLLDDGLIVLVQGDTAAVESARTLEGAASLGLEQVVAANPLRINPFADGITQEGRL